MLRRALAIVTVAGGAGVLLWAGSKAGQRNGITVVGGGGGQALPPSPTAGGELHTAVASGAAAALVTHALATAVEGIV